MKKKNKYISCFLFIFCLSLGGIFVKYSYLGPINTGMYRVLFSIPMFFLLNLGIKSKNKMPLQEVMIAIIAGMSLGMDLILWNISFSYTTVANANLLANLVPFTVIPLSFIFFHEKINKNFFLSVIICLIGLFILIYNEISLEFYKLKGDFLAILTSFFYGMFFIMVYKLRKTFNFIQIMLYASIGCLVVLFPTSYYIEGLEYPKSMAELFPLLGLAIISQIIGQGGLSFALGKISANLASVLVLTQPVVAAIFAYILFHEKLEPNEVMGYL